MSVKGNYETPKELNFYFPVTITTPQGFAMNLLLAQSGHTRALVQKLKAISPEAKVLYKAVTFDAEVDSVEAFAFMATMEFISLLVDLLKDLENPWYVTVKGTKDWPSVSATKGLPRILGIGPTRSGGMQACSFYYDSKNTSNYTFNLKLYPEVESTVRR